MQNALSALRGNRHAAESATFAASLRASTARRGSRRDDTDIAAGAM
jgi:hypothetical protein